MKKKNWSRTLSLLLAVALVAGLLVVPASATLNENNAEGGIHVIDPAKDTVASEGSINSYFTCGKDNAIKIGEAATFEGTLSYDTGIAEDDQLTVKENGTLPHFETGECKNSNHRYIEFTTAADKDVNIRVWWSTGSNVTPSNDNAGRIARLVKTSDWAKIPGAGKTAPESVELFPAGTYSQNTIYLTEKKLQAATAYRLMAGNSNVHFYRVEVIETDKVASANPLDDVAETVEAETYTATAVEAHDAASAKTKAQELVTAAVAGNEGVTATVNDGTYAAAENGTASAPEGKDGSYKFTVTLSDDSHSAVTTSEITMTITATAYEPVPNSVPGEGYGEAKTFLAKNASLPSGQTSAETEVLTTDGDGIHFYLGKSGTFTTSGNASDHKSVASGISYNTNPVGGSENPQTSGSNTTVGQVPDTGTYYKFVADKAGKLEIVYKINGGKTFVAVKGGEAPSTVATVAAVGGLDGWATTIDVEAGATYYVYAATTTKLLLYGFTFWAEAEEVVEKEMTVSAADVTADYDGKAKTITVKATDKGAETAVTGAEVQYKLSTEEAYKDEQPEMKNAGKYTVDYKVTAEGYKEAAGQAIVTINKNTEAQGKITLEADHTKVTQTDGEVLFTVKGVPADSSVKPTLTCDPDGPISVTLDRAQDSSDYTGTYNVAANDGGAEKTHVVSVVWVGDDNYEGIKTAGEGQKVTITQHSSSAKVSQVEFAEMSASIYAKAGSLVGETQQDAFADGAITFTADPDKDTTQTITVSGKLKYAEGLTNFNKSNPKEQEGYYLLWMFEVPTEYQTAGTVTVKKGASSTTDKTFNLNTGLDADGDKQYFSMVHQISPKTGTVEILVDGDGAGSDYIETVYTLDLSGVTFEPQPMGADFVVAGTLSTEDVGGTLTATATKVGYETYEVTVNSTDLTAHKRTGVEPADTEDDFWIGVGLPQINFDNNSLFVSEDGSEWQHIGGNQVDKGGKKYSMTYVNLPDDVTENASLTLYYKVTPDKGGEADPTGETLQYYTVTFKADKLTYPDYTITNGTATGETGTISAIKVKDAAGTTAKAGDTITVETTPAENYTLDAVTVASDVEGIEVEVSKVGNNATFTMPASDVTVTATFKEGTTPKTITVVAAPLGEGSSATSYTVEGSGDEGGTVNVTITADSLTEHANGAGTKGYWVGFGMPVEEGATYTYKADEGDTATTEVNGPKDRTFTKDGQTYATIYMTVDEANTETKYTVTQTKADEPAVTTTYKVTITVKALVPAETEPETTYALTGVATPENSGTVTFKVGGTAATTAKESDTVTVVATPETGYKLKSVTAVQTDTDTAVTIGADNTFTMPTAAVTVTATFEKEEEEDKPLPENAVVWTDARKDQVDMFTFWVKNATSGEFEEGYSAKPTSGITAAMLEGALKDFTDYLDTTSLAVKFKPNNPDVGKTTFTTATSGTLTLVFIDQASKENQAGCTLDGQVINGFVDGTKETVSVREIELEAGDHVFLSGRDTFDKEISMYLMMWVPDGDAPTTPTVTSVTIEGPDTVKVGEEITLTATVAMSDGSTDAAGVTWTASNGNATVEAGKVTGVTAGEVVITATSVTDATKSNTKTITVTAEDAGGDEVDKSALQEAVDAAHKKYDDVVASEDGTDVRTTKEWMPEADLKAAQDAIAAAEAVLKDESADADAVKNAVDALANALSGLTEPAAGTKRTSSGVSNGTTGGVGVDKENTDKTTETKPDGSKVVTATQSDGSKTVTTTTPAGEVTADVTLGHGASSTTVTVPVEDANTGMVPVVVNPDGTEEIIRDSYVDEDGNVVFDLDESATVKIVDNAKHFVDIDNHWAEDDVNFVTARELFNGMDTTHFVPNDAMTRAMMATVLFRLDGEHESEAAIDFTDVAAGDWFVEAVDWAAEMGVITGYSDGTFAPDKSITRQELVAMVYRFAGSPAVEGAMGMAGYDDADQVADWASAAMHWAVANGIIQGKGDNCLHPAGEATRAEVAAVLQRFVRLDK